MRPLQPGGQCPRIYISHEQGGPIIPRALVSLFVASYDFGLLWQYSNRLRTETHSVSLKVNVILQDVQCQ
jgi:hypothetical protein